jgi:hypoxanthine phosphoribosyltransferase
MDKINISWDKIQSDCEALARKINAGIETVDTVIAIAKGGLIPARLIYEYTEAKHFYVIGTKLYEGENRGNKVIVYQDLPGDTDWSGDGNILVVDDVCDSGATFNCVYDRIKGKNFKAQVFTVTPYTKKSAKFEPYFTLEEFPDDMWIVFPWEESIDNNVS